MSKSLEQLENDYWKDQDEYLSGLIGRCHTYRKIPVHELSVEQLRTLLGQDIGSKFLLPIAILILKENILAEGNMFEGDLLTAICRRNDWSLFQMEHDQIQLIITKNIELIREHELEISGFKLS